MYMRETAVRVDICEDESMERIQPAREDCPLYPCVLNYSLVEPVRGSITEPRWPMWGRLSAAQKAMQLPSWGVGDELMSVYRRGP